LYSVPELTQPWVDTVSEQLESQAAKMGRSLLQAHKFNDDAAADAGSRVLSRPDSSEEKAA
jgi:hypothetical protein